MNYPFISIIIPAYNAELYIKDCVESICCQSTPPHLYEIIIINDGSTDNTLRVIESLIDRFKNIKLINQVNCGVSSARNKGIHEATGRYIWFIDADDSVLDNALELFIQYIKSTNADLISALYKSETNATSHLTKIIKKRFSVHRHFFSSCVKLDLIRNNDIYFETDIQYGEDILWFDMVKYYSVHIFRLNYIVYLYKKRPNSAMSICNNKKQPYIESLIKRLYIYRNYLKNNKHPNYLQLQYAQNEVIRNILFFYLRNRKIKASLTFKQLEQEGFYPYPFLWKDITTFYNLSDYCIKLFCFLFPFKFYYVLMCNLYSKISK